MSFPNTGSVTELVGENGTRFTHSRSVSQAPETAPATPMARSTANRATTHVPTGTRLGMSSVSNTNPGPAGCR
jgi:hypothetical protein